MQSISFPRQHIGCPSYQKTDLVDWYASSVFLTVTILYRETLNIIWIILLESSFDKIGIKIKNSAVGKNKYSSFKQFL